MLGIEHDAVLIVIYIWRILEKPVTVVNRQWNDAVVLACRMVDTSCISLISLQSWHFGYALCFAFLLPQWLLDLSPVWTD